MSPFLCILGLHGLILSFVSLLFLCGCIYLIHIHNEYSHIPGPRRSSFFLGNVPEIKRYLKEDKLLYDYYLDLYHKFGPLFVIFVVHRPMVLVTDPLYIKQVIIDWNEYTPKDQSLARKIQYIYGDRALGYGLTTNVDRHSWFRRRQMLNPAFHRKYLKNLMTPFNEVCDRLCERLTDCATKSEEISMLDELHCTTIDIIGQVAFSLDLGSIGDPSFPFCSAAIRFLEAIRNSLESPFPSWLLSIYRWRVLQSEIQQSQIAAIRFLRDFSRKCISERIMKVKDGDHVPNDILSYIVKCTEKDPTLTLEDLVDEMVLIFIAGHETTGNSLAFTLFEVISNEDIEKNILREVEEVIGDKERVDVEDLPKLKYVGQCLMESLRKFMIGSRPVRTLTKEVILGGYRIPAGCVIQANKYAMSRSPDFWKDPDVFDPTRFESTEDIPHFRYTFFPFSLGPINCIGQTFAMFEMKVLLARLIQKFKFQLVPGQTSKIEDRSSLTPKDGVRCTVKLR